MALGRVSFQIWSPSLFAFPLEDTEWRNVERMWRRERAPYGRAILLDKIVSLGRTKWNLKTSLKIISWFNVYICTTVKYFLYVCNKTFTYTKKKRKEKINLLTCRERNKSFRFFKLALSVKKILWVKWIWRFPLGLVKEHWGQVRNDLCTLDVKWKKKKTWSDDEIWTSSKD